MKLGLHQSTRLEQRLIQSPQMIQAMQILQLSGLDLMERVEQELSENPFLEQVENEAREEEEAPGGPGTDRREAPRDERKERNGVENMLEVLERYERDFGDGSRRPRSQEDGDRKLEAMQNTPDAPKSLAEALREPLVFLEMDERGREIAEYLIDTLDHRGYLSSSLEEVAAALNASDSRLTGVTVEELEATLAELRRVIHPALGARDLRECLLLQLDAGALDAAHADVALVRQLVSEHLEDITTNRLPRIAKATGHTIDEVKHGLEALRTLDPTPVADYEDAQAAVILPDVVVEEIDGDWEVRLPRQRAPELRLSPHYRQILSQARAEGPAKDWVKKRLESARWFIDALQQRQSTLQKIAGKLFEHQRGFLEKGVRGLQPLRMQEIADEVGVHISTVSRAVAGKYAQTPRGTYPLKYFFTSGTPRESGGIASQASIKQRIAELVRNEDSSSPLSDDQLAALLEKRDRIKIARRTVTKYRKALAIPSSSQRKTF
jgi:RNA polymerase sigma-54 factor